MNLLFQNKNGNCSTFLYEDGTREIEYENICRPDYPFNLDVKITQYCDMDKICVFCHEQSNKLGKHGNLDLGIKLFKQLPAGTEIAIGGGNPLSHPNLIWFLNELKRNQLIANLTVNQLHLKPNLNKIISLLAAYQNVKGLGISYRNDNFEFVKTLSRYSENIVFHVIAGLNDIEVLDKLSNICPDKLTKILILGYKQFGNGKNHYNNFTKKVDDNLLSWYRYLPKYFGRKNLLLTFDNLAIKQLNLKRFFPQKEWDVFYQGDDGTGSMYIDLVKEEYCVSSTSKERFKFNSGDLDMKNIFNQIKK